MKHFGREAEIIFEQRVDRDNSGYLDRFELRELIKDLKILLKDVELDNDFIFGKPT